MKLLLIHLKSPKIFHNTAWHHCNHSQFTVQSLHYFGINRAITAITRNSTWNHFNHSGFTTKSLNLLGFHHEITSITQNWPCKHCKSLAILRHQKQNKIVLLIPIEQYKSNLSYSSVDVCFATFHFSCRIRTCTGISCSSPFQVDYHNNIIRYYSKIMKWLSLHEASFQFWKI